MKYLRVLLTAPLIFAALSTQAVPIISDNFNDGVIDSSTWQVILPFGVSSVVESSGSLTTTGRGTLATVADMPDSYSIAGEFTLNSSLEISRVNLRTDLSLHPGLGSYGERVGIWVTFHAANGAVYIENGLGVGPIGVGHNYPWVIGQTYSFSIIDDSQNVTVSINGIQEASLAISERAGDKIAFSSREFSSTSSTFDNIVISSVPDSGGSFGLLVLAIGGLAASGGYRLNRTRISSAPIHTGR